VDYVRAELGVSERKACRVLRQHRSTQRNGYCESFNEKLRDELLNGEIFYMLNEAKIVIEAWRQHYNTVCPHSSLGYRPPAPEVIAWPTVKSVAPRQTLN
jgi:transposase InsO family protein